MSYQNRFGLTRFLNFYCAICYPKRIYQTFIIQILHHTINFPIIWVTVLVNEDFFLLLLWVLSSSSSSSSSKTFWTSFLLSNLTITLTDGKLLCSLPPLWFLASRKLEWSIFQEGCWLHCSEFLQFICIHNASIVQVCEFFFSFPCFFLHLNFYDWSNESSKFFPNFFFIITLLWTFSFSLFKTSNLVSVTLHFSQNFLLSLTVIVIVVIDIRLFCIFIVMFISCSLVFS